MAEATEATIPFTGQTVDLTSTQALFVVIALTLGFMLWHAADDMGSTLWSKVSSMIAGVAGTNPSTGEDTGVPGV